MNDGNIIYIAMEMKKAKLGLTIFKTKILGFHSNNEQKVYLNSLLSINVIKNHMLHQNKVLIDATFFHEYWAE